MKVELFGTDLALLDRWEKILSDYNPSIADALNGDAKAVIVDFDTAKRESLEYLRDHQNGNCASLILLQSAPSVGLAKRLIALGAKGYGNSYMQTVHLKSCVETVLSGNIWVFPEFVYSLIGDINRDSPSAPKSESGFIGNLTEREREIIAYLLKGNSNAQIADAMNITVRTVKAHLGKIYEKAGVCGRLDLVLMLKAE